MEAEELRKAVDGDGGDFADFEVGEESGGSNNSDGQETVAADIPSVGGGEEEEEAGAEAKQQRDKSAEVAEVEGNEGAKEAVLEKEKEEDQSKSSCSTASAEQSQQSKAKVPPQQPRMKSTPSRAVLAPDVTHIPVQPSEIIEYEWPPKNGDRYFVQEQISEFLGISSFKRKYPAMQRRTVEPAERDHLIKELKMVMRLPAHHLTALQATDCHELMANEHPDNYAEYQRACQERTKRQMAEKQRELEAIKLDAKKMAELRQKAIKNAHDFNAELQHIRRTERTQYWDLNTNIIHSPLNKWHRLAKEHTKPSLYPVALIPGQYSAYCKRFDAAHLRSLPFNTVLRPNHLFAPRHDPSPPPLTITEEEMKALARAEEEEEEANGPNQRTQPQKEPSGSSTPNRSNNNNNCAGNNNANSGKRVPAAVKQEVQQSSNKIGGMNSNNSNSRLTMITRDQRERNNNGSPQPKQRRLATMTAAGRSRKTSSSSTHFAIPSPKIAAASPRTPIWSSKMPTPGQSSGLRQQQSATAGPAGGGTTGTRVCSICQLEDSNAHTKALLVRCADCRKQMHSSCIVMPPSMVEVVRRYDWLCIDCKRCCVCQQPDQEAAMMCCDQCDRGYHTFCIGLDQPPNGTWHCPECKGE